MKNECKNVRKLTTWIIHMKSINVRDHSRTNSLLLSPTWSLLSSLSLQLLLKLQHSQRLDVLQLPWLPETPASPQPPAASRTRKTSLMFPRTTSTGSSGPGPGGSVAWPATPAPSASTGPTDTPQGDVTCWRAAVNQMETRLTRVDRLGVPTRWRLFQLCSIQSPSSE